LTLPGRCSPRPSGPGFPPCLRLPSMVLVHPPVEFLRGASPRFFLASFPPRRGFEPAVSLLSHFPFGLSHGVFQLGLPSLPFLFLYIPSLLRICPFLGHPIWVPPGAPYGVLLPTFCPFPLAWPPVPFFRFAPGQGPPSSPLTLVVVLWTFPMSDLRPVSCTPSGIVSTTAGHAGFFAPDVFFP